MRKGEYDFEKKSDSSLLWLIPLGMVFVILFVLGVVMAIKTVL